MSSQTSPLPVGLRSVDACWESLASMPLVHQSWPSEETTTVDEALRAWAPDIYNALALKHALVQRFGVIPIVAVVGLLNSGKSSLTASFLSDHARARVLRGSGHLQGSQRFTLWIPADWKDDAAFFSQLLELLTRVFQHEPEELSAEPDLALAQQNDVRSIAVPLLATDSALQAHGLALLDCPDIQRSGEGDLRTRLDMVQRSAEICAAILVVLARSQIEIRDLQMILDRMPEAERIYAVNLIRREQPEKVRAELIRAFDLVGPQRIYGAYDFLASDFTERTPSWDPNRDRSPAERLALSQPCFYEIRESPEENFADSIEPQRSLLNLARSVSPDAMQSRRLQELGKDFFRTLETGLDTVAKTLNQGQSSLVEAERRLLDESRYLITQGGRLRIKMSPEIVTSIEQSLGRTASFYYKWFLLPPRRFLQGCIRLLQKARDLGMPGREIREKKEELKRRWKVPSSTSLTAGSVGAEDLQRMLSLWSGATGDYQPPEAWKKEAEIALHRFIDEDKTNLTDEEWDAITGPLWEQIPLKARLQIFSSVFLMLGSLALAFLDGGVSFVTVSAMDLLGGIGLLASLGVNIQGASEFQRVLEEKLGLKQVANFHAILCDTVGLPRQNLLELPAPTVATQTSRHSYGITKRQWRRYHLNPSTLNRLRQHAHQHHPPVLPGIR